jgi:dTDP-glucose pyrophosphorylase
MIEKLLLSQDPLVEAIRAIEASHKRIAVVVSETGKLIGTLTDGDIRRCLLVGGSLQTTVAEAMNANPITAIYGASHRYLLDIMRHGNIRAVPLVDDVGRFIKLVHSTDLDPKEMVSDKSPFEFAVIMAGGEGRRLGSITEKIPKPMVDIGGAPLLERQVKRLAVVGLKRIYISVNYLHNVIEDHFGDGSCFGVEIRYLRENKKMGTGGALALLPERPTEPIVVMNGDIITTSDFSSLGAFHLRHGAVITLAAVEYCVKIPLGVIEHSGSDVLGLVEKPSQRFLCNAGIYALDPSALDDLQALESFNMTDMVHRLLSAGRKVAVFPVHEYWSDIGTPADLDRARSLFV